MIKNKILKILKIEVFYEIVDFFVLDKPIFYSKVAQKGNICSRLLEPQKVAPDAKSRSKVADHNNRERSTDGSLKNNIR